MAPLREAVGPQGDQVMVKVPFSPNDLMIWKQSAGSYREDPDRMARVVKMVIKTQNPDWNDLQVLLDTLMDSTEKEMVLRAMTEKAREMIRLRVVDGTLNELVPREDPEWDPNTARGHQALKEYQELLIEGVRTGIPKTVNWSKLYSVKQEKNESPSAFLERLKETARRYTSLEVEGEAGRLQLALIFMGQSQEDIRKKNAEVRSPESLIGRDLLSMLQARIIFEGDDISLAAMERDICSQLTISLLNMLGQGGYRVLRDKAQLALLREQDDIELKITPHLNPAEFLRSEREEGELVHDCVEIIEQVYASREDLKDAPIDSPDWELFTDGSSFVENGTRYAGYAVVTTLQVIEAKALPPGTSAQKAEIRALTRALELSKGKRVNVWTDSKYALGWCMYMELCGKSGDC
ncbi:hypothetical protein DUI87_18832 [Hirundo rustica rustica]|uniref:RNase H type-1 domain-containing protein n=1 Tax=Hirundo rustica rustica TaxID=333673 RepID=A0A3M0JV37_HIRRU|nr:hypothetical protein DUI87_18832 [Hirundo rustica rustica]